MYFETALCPCGERHPAGFVCEKALAAKLREAAPSPSRTVYRIMNMDCPAEEALIRKKLGSIPGIEGLEFNLMRRVLTIDHALPSADALEAALREIDMIPEPVEDEAVAVFSVKGMDCPDEERLIRAALAGKPGVLDLECNLMRRTLKVRHVPSALPAVSAALDSLDMGAELLGDERAEDAVVPESKIPWRKLALAAVFAALSEGFELVADWRAKPFGLDMGTWSVGGFPVLDVLPPLCAIAAIALSGLGTYKKGWIALSNFNLNINALMSAAVTGAVLIGRHPEAAMVMTLFNVSEAIEAKALDRARNAVKDLLALAPETACVLQPDGSWRETDVRRVAAGSRVRVAPGEKIALDGVVVRGRSTVDQSSVTGESMPAEKKEGDVVYAGTLNETGSFEFETTAGASDSTLARIIRAVEEAQETRAPMQRFVDAFARRYTPAIFVVAVLAAVVPPLLFAAPWRESVYTALVVLVVGCPCALVISTPVAVVSGMAAAARSGILIKGGAFLEQGRKLRWLALDKTGTITSGKPRQIDFVLFGDLDEARVEILAASLASRSDHPVSRALAEHAALRGVVPLEAEDFAALPGKGVRGVVDGRVLRLGSPKILEDSERRAPELERRVAELERRGGTVVLLADETGVQGLFVVADAVRESSVEAVKELKKLGVKTMMLTGDNERAAEVVAAQAGVDVFRANLLPEEKLRVVERLAADGGLVGMAGDGVNDAPALAKADVGFAMARGGADAAVETADVALMDDDLRKIPRFIRLSRSTCAILTQNVALALGVKTFFLALAFAGSATMWMAVFADAGAALLVVGNGLRALRK